MALVPHSARPHSLCLGCNLVLTSREFSTQQLRGGRRDEHRRCRRCVGTLQCAACQAVLPVTDFSIAQQRKPLEARRCPACVMRSEGFVGSRSDNVAAFGPLVVGRGGGVWREVCAGGGGQAYWRWVLAFHRAMSLIPSEVIPRVLRFLANSAGAGVAELGPNAACAACDVCWPRAWESAAAHRRSRRHQVALATWRSVCASAAECAAAARAAGVSEAEAQAAKAAALAVAAADAAAPAPLPTVRRRWGRLGD